MARRSLRPHLNQIRTWVRQGRTDAWIAHQLEVTVQQIETFKRENELSVDSTPDTGAEGAAAGVDFDDEIDLRAEDDALIAAELEAEQAKAAEEAAAAAVAAAAAAAEKAAAGEDEESEAEKAAATRRRGRRGRGRRTKNTLEGSFDHGEEGYGLWLDPAVEENPLYAEHWAGHRPVEVTIEADRIIIRRASAGDGEDED
jgi:hypothetical protein